MSVEHLEVIRFAEVTDMLDRCVLMWGGLMVNVFVAQAQPYDFANANALLEAERLNLDGHVAVLIRQDGTEVFRRRFQLGDIDFDTQVRMASFTKTVSAGVVLSLVEDGVLALDERLGDALPAYQAGGIGDPTFLDCWSMRHGIETPGEYHRSALLTLEQSIAAIGLQGFTVFTPPGSQLGYDGVGQHSVGAVGVFRTGLDWESLAQARIFGPCAMVNSDYQQFAPNPAIAGGLRSTANDTIQYAQMIIDRGWFDGERVLNEASIARLFTNETRGLPVYHSPWPPTHPLYPYGCDPDYAFGCVGLGRESADCPRGRDHRRGSVGQLHMDRSPPGIDRRADHGRAGRLAIVGGRGAGDFRYRPTRDRLGTGRSLARRAIGR
jgi:CubicO group peptidase (beta-lactamase class C family)